MASKVTCVHCKEQVNIYASVCPYCTREITPGYQEPGNRKMFFIGAVATLVLIPMIALFTGNGVEFFNEYYLSGKWWIFWIVLPFAGGSGLQHLYINSRRW